MKYLKQFLIIAAVSFAGELLKWLIPLPISASVYGVFLMFLCLALHIIKVEDVRETALFLIEIMPVMFIPAAVGLMESWSLIRSSWASYLVITAFSSVIVMGVSAMVTQTVRKFEKKGAETNE